VSLTVGAIVGFLIFSSLPVDAWVLAGSRDEQITFAILLMVVIVSIWAHVALARRRPYGRILALGLGIYACVMAANQAVAFARRGVPSDASLLASLAIGGTMLAALIVGALACLPGSRARGDDLNVPAV
jgi:endonuclease/exonuclease/phosphatase (EEP) superfamily protein YafD